MVEVFWNEECVKTLVSATLASSVLVLFNFMCLDLSLLVWKVIDLKIETVFSMKTVLC